MRRFFLLLLGDGSSVSACSIARQYYMHDRRIGQQPCISGVMNAAWTNCSDDDLVAASPARPIIAHSWQGRKFCERLQMLQYPTYCWPHNNIPNMHITMHVIVCSITNTCPSPELGWEWCWCLRASSRGNNELHPSRDLEAVARIATEILLELRSWTVVSTRCESFGGFGGFARRSHTVVRDHPSSVQNST